MNPLSDPNNPQPQPSASTQPATVSNTPPANVAATPAPAPASDTPTVSTQPQSPSTQPAQQQPAKPTQPSNANQQPDTGSVSNAAPVHPSVQRASVIRQVATMLAGGDRYSTTIDPNSGATVRTPLPLSKSDIGFAIMLEAVSGGLAGLSQRGPGATGMAAAAGFQQGSQQEKEADQAQKEASQQQLQNETQALTRRANAYEQNSRTILNTAQAERYGVESLKDAVSQNADVLSAYDDAGAVQERNVSQDALYAGLQSNKYSATSQVAIPDGWSNLNGKYEQTFAIVSNPAAKLPLSQAQWNTFAADHIRGFPAGVKIADGTPVPGYILARANAQVQAINLMKQDFTSVSDALTKSGDKNNQELAKSIPAVQSLLDDPNNGPVFQNALSKLQKWVSHSDMHGMDFYESLQQMASPSMPDPRNPKEFIPNPSAATAQVIAGAFGDGDPQKGWQILQRYHDEVTPVQVKSEAEAESVLADPSSSSKAKVQARSFLHIAQQQKQSDKASGGGNGTLNVSSLSPKEYQAIIDGIGTNSLDASQMLRYGKADQLKILADVKGKYPSFDSTQYQANLGLAKWATSGKGGDQIQALNTLRAHTQDFNENLSQLGNVDASFLNAPINKLKSMTGNPNVVSTVGRMLAVRTEYMNVLNNNHALSVEDKADAASLLNENQSPQQWLSAINQINHTAELRGAQTNARYKATFGRDMPNYHAAGSASSSASRPSGSGQPQFQFTTKDGKQGWNGSQWISTGR